MIIQLFLLLIILIILVFIIARFRKKELTTVQFGFWLLVWVAGGIVVADPAIPQRIANELGIGRGADLVIYLAIIFIVFVLFRMLLRQERMEREITKVVREIALTQVQSSKIKVQSSPSTSSQQTETPLRK